MEGGGTNNLSDRSSWFPSLMAEDIGIFACPSCEGDLEIVETQKVIRCTQCHDSFHCENGIPLFFRQHEMDPQEDVTKPVKAFYEENPFPGYEDLDSKWSLEEKARKGFFARQLNEQIPIDARVLEVGCGTGQLTNFLGIRQGRTVFGTDMCLNSLKLGQSFKERNQIAGAAFFQMNLFRPIFKPEIFDLVVSNGVLHHTGNPFLGFQGISRLVKRDGFIVIGLYNAYGRIPTKVRRFIFDLTGGRFTNLDPRFRDSSISEHRKRTWFMDQYRNPHESSHTIPEVLGWFDRAGFKFVSSIPKARAFVQFREDENLFSEEPAGTPADWILVQLGLLLKGGREGGFFIMIGRKNPDL